MDNAGFSCYNIVKFIYGEFKMKNYVKKIRRELHEYPEIGFDLPKTLALIRRELEDIGIEYTEDFGKSSIVATINPEKCGYTVGLRADTDALPIKETTGLPFSSKIDGQMHACGHDAHTAILLTAARELYAMRDKINCRVKLIFQAAEEYAPSGAMLMARDGVMRDIDVIGGLHVDTNHPTGTVGLLSGELSAISDGFVLKFFGKKAHAANQHKGVDAILMAVSAITEIEMMIAKRFNAKDSVIFNVGSIHGGIANNIVCDECELYCTARTFNEELGNRVKQCVLDVCEGVTRAWGGSYEHIQKKYYPIVYNNPTLHERAKGIVARVLGEDKIEQAKRGLGGEDFAYFAKEKPGYFFRLGTKKPGAESVIGVHNGGFTLDEDCLEVGVKLLCEFVLDCMNGID